jgi:hypothetical protein
LKTTSSRLVRREFVHQLNRIYRLRTLIARGLGGAWDNAYDQ